MHNFKIETYLAYFQQYGLPLIPCLSKSGGLHCYIFFNVMFSFHVVCIFDVLSIVVSCCLAVLSLCFSCCLVVV